MAPDNGYTEIRLTNLALAPGYCRQGILSCPDRLFSVVTWNGVRLDFDGIEASASGAHDLSITELGQIRGDVLFGVDNTLFGDGLTGLAVRFFSRGGEKAIKLGSKGAPREVDCVETSIDLRQSRMSGVTGRRGLVKAAVLTRATFDRSGRTYEVVIGSGSYDEMLNLRQLINEGQDLSFEGRKVMGVIRPPLASRETWGMALGVRDDETGRVRILFTEPEAQRLVANLRRLPPAQLGPLATVSPRLYKLRGVFFASEERGTVPRAPGVPPGLFQDLPSWCSDRGR